MNNVHHIREAKSTERQASEWVALLASGDASAEDRAACDAWLREHPSHQAAFDQVNRTWDRLRLMGDKVRDTIPADLDPKAMARCFTAPEKRPRRRKRLTWAAAAAAVLVVTIVGTLLYPFDASTLYRTEVGQRMTLTLPDRSTVELNTDTELRVAYSDRARRIELRRGEAFFDVVRDSNRPFVVEAGQGAIRAVGTGFVVRMQNEAVKVTVTEGVVEVTHGAIDRDDVSRPAADDAGDPPPAVSPAKLRVGQRAEYDRRVVSVAALPPKELDRDLAWRQGLLIFDGQTLDEVVREVGRYTDTRLIVADSDLQELRVGGAFRAGDLEAVLEFFEKGLNVSVNRDTPRTIYLTANRPATSE